jgi:aryl-alcohol dehydrogenase-like predicted oxidoreductase
MVFSQAGRLALGTAQLGKVYGVANELGQPTAREATAILDLATGAGMHCLDTAADYGEAELRIASYLRRCSPGRQVSVVTKLTVEHPYSEGSIRAAVAGSRSRLGVVPAAILLHDAALLGSWQGSLGRALCSARADGEVGAIGVSIYTPEQFAQALALPEIDIIQAPFNVFDRRLERSGLLQAAVDQGVRLMLRSAFLQGLLLLDPDRCPATLTFALPRLRRWHALCARYQLEPVAVALRFVMQRVKSATVVVGCESRAQLSQLLAAANAEELPAEMIDEVDDLASTENALIDPTRWLS